MQKFILIRGHQGSGKSTYAAKLIAEFKQTYPNAKVVHIENDKELTDENGVYYWSPELVSAAQEKGRVAFKNNLKRGRKYPEQDILIINSNTNQKSSVCIQLLQTARKNGFKTEVYRMHNFLPNLHNVPEEIVLEAYVKLDNNPLRDEIHVPAEYPMSPEQRAQIEEMKSFKTHKPKFDTERNTYVTEDYLRLGRRDFTMKPSRKYPQLSVLKYNKDVFFENRFDDALLEMRGMVLDKRNQIIVRPFAKVFNYSERIAKDSRYPLQIEDDKLVNAVVKVNGFLGCCTYVQLAEGNPSFGEEFNNQILYSTTGSLDSNFAKMTEQHCSPHIDLFKAYPNHTFMFEITDENDVHIIKEELGETLIGIRNVATGVQFSEDELDNIAEQYGIKRPETIKGITFGALKDVLKDVKHEGFMVFDAQTNELLFKLKSPFYLVSKFFGRSTEGNIGRKLDKRHVDEEFYPLIDHIQANREAFDEMDEQAKIAFVQSFLHKQLFD